MKNNSRVFGLDILRALAILLVVTGHSYYFLPASFKNNVLSVFPDGVAIFFVLSGYLIGGILIRTLERDGAGFGNLLNFWVRRWMRTLPLYFLILLILCILSYAFVPGFSISSVGKYFILDRKSTRLNSSHVLRSRMPSSA